MLAYITLLYVFLIIIAYHRSIPAGPLCSADRFSRINYYYYRYYYYYYYYYYHYYYYYY